MEKRRKLTHDEYYRLRNQFEEDYANVTQIKSTAQELAEHYSELLNMTVSITHIRDMCKNTNRFLRTGKTHGIAQIYEKLTALQNRVEQLELTVIKILKDMES